MVYLRTFCKTCLSALLAGLLLTDIAMAQDITSRAMKLYEKHWYDEAGRLLHPQMGQLDEASQPGARLALGMIYLRNAELYFELQRNAVVIQSDYLKKLTAQKGPDSSRYADYYLGLVSLEDGKYSDSSRQLQKFIANADVTAGNRSLAKVDLGLSYWGLKQGELANSQWNLTASSATEEKAALAAAYAFAGMQNRKPVELADQLLAEIRKQGKAPSMQLTQRLVRAYGRSDAIEKALDLLDASELRTAVFIETLGKSKSISFYDPGLLGDMAHVYLRAAIQYLEQASQNPKLSMTAAFFLADAHLLANNLEQANRYSASFLSQAQIPTAYQIHARAIQAASSYRAGKQQEALSTWSELFDLAAVRPELQAEILNACVLARANCAKFEQLAVSATEAGEGKKFFPLNAALGKYYLARKNYTKAVLHMEAGRDKANKNKIEVNDPTLLAMLAQAYFYNKKFSESLEIYFEMSKQYPAIRQIQDSLQGIYSIEQKSAGDVKIF